MKVHRRVSWYFLSNSYLGFCEGGGEAFIVDPAPGCGELLGVARRKGMRVRYVLVTHYHPDHIGGAGRVKALTGAPIVAHASAEKMAKSTINRIGSGMGLIFKVAGPDRFVEDGEELAVGDESLRVIHTPGHTPDGISISGRGFVFTGDTLVAGSVGRTDLAGGSVRELAETLAKKLLPLPDDTVVYPGHGPATTIGKERRYNPFVVGAMALGVT
ncbi:MAG: MBL fold metallo-hydrolase [bacterium]